MPSVQGTAAEDIGSNAVSDIANANVEDGVYATATINSDGAQVRWACDLSAVSTLTGLVQTIDAHCENPTVGVIKLRGISIHNAAGDIITEQLVDSPLRTTPGTTDVDLTEFSLAQVQATRFVSVSFRDDDGGNDGTLSVDGMHITYTEVPASSTGLTRRQRAASTPRFHGSLGVR